MSARLQFQKQFAEGNVVNISSQDALVITENLQKGLSENTVMYIADQITIGIA